MYGLVHEYDYRGISYRVHGRISDCTIYHYSLLKSS